MASVYNFSVDQGATKRLRMLARYQTGVDDLDQPTYETYDLSGCSARMQLRQAVNGPVLAELSTENGRIALEADGQRGQVDIVLTADDTSALELRRAVYDLELVWPSGDVTRLIQGKVSVSLNVTE